MRRTRPRSLLLFLVPLMAAACDEGGDAPLARPHELRMEIVRGKGIRDTVRASSQPADLLQDDSVVVRVFAVLDADAGAGVTGPDREARIPPVELAWRTLDPWCQPEQAVTPLREDDRAANRLRVPTVAGDCRLVVEGIVNGFVFATDTAVAGFAPGPLATFSVLPVFAFVAGAPFDVRQGAGSARDEHGNFVPVTGTTFRVTITSGAPVFTASDSIIHANGEGYGTAQVTGGPLVLSAPLWAIRDMRGDWRLSWACYDAPLPGGAHADSAHYVLGPAEAAYGSTMASGVAVRFIGTLTTRLWVRGQPVQETRVLNTLRFGAQLPGTLEWAPGQVATPTPTGYAGGSLCEPGPQGSTWARATPVRADRL